MLKNPPNNLLQRCTENDRRAHFELYEYCFESLYSLARRYYSNDEELKSIVNDAFLNLVVSLPKLLKSYESANFFFWMRKIAVNSIIDEFRSRRKYRELIELKDQMGEIRHTGDEFDPINEGFELKAIQQIVDSLPAASRTVFNLYAIEGYKHHEIGSLLNISPNTSKVHLFLARKQIQQALTNLNTITT